MTTTATTGVGLSEHGITAAGTVVWNPSTSQLYTETLRRGQGVLAHGGPLVVDTGKHTGRSPKDKFVVDEDGSRDRIWWGEVNQPLAEASFAGLREKVVDHLGGLDPLYVVDAFAGAAHRTGVRVITGSPYHALFAKTMFITPTADERHSLVPEVVIFHAPAVECRPGGRRDPFGHVRRPASDPG